MDDPKQVTTTQRAWTGLQGRGFAPLGIAGIGALGAAILFGIATLLRSACDGPCTAGWGVPAGILETIGFVAILAAIAAVGHWIGHMAHHTWIDRMRLELDGDVDPIRRDRLETWTGDANSSQVQLRARLNFWTATPVAAISIVMMPAAMGFFADPDAFAPYLLPIVLLSAIAATAAMLRGAILLTSARRLARPDA